MKKYKIKKKWLLTLKECVEKQIPKQVVIKQRFLLDRFCPRCDENLINCSCYSLNSWKYNYCPCCGQRLKWDKDIFRLEG